MKLIDECKNPPRGMLRHVRRSIGWIFPGDLEGIYSLRLIDELSPRNEVASESWYKAAARHGHTIRGWYKPKDKTDPHIVLNIRDIYKCIPRFYWRTPVATLVITYVLAHEVGHHISRKKGYVFSPTEKLNNKTRQDEENFAFRYAATVMARMRRRWYYRVAAWAIRDLAGWHYIGGILDWREAKYKAAAERWYKACVLDPDNVQAAYWYWRAKEMSDSKRELSTQDRS